VIDRKVVTFTHVKSQAPDFANQWFDWLPYFALVRTIENSSGFGSFVKGTEYYLDLAIGAPAA
jgi:hypothetical protein